MRFPKKVASILVAAILSVAGLTAVTLAVGHDGRWSNSARAEPGKGQPGGKQMCQRGHGGMHGMHGRLGHKGSDYLAKKLAVMETEIGIRANQLDAWRDFTDALQATMKHPKRPGGPGMMAPGDSAEPFSLAERLADNTIERAKSAEELKKAIAALRTTLTAEQLEKVKEIEARVRDRMAMHHGWKQGHRGMGPHGMGPHGMGSHGKGPQGMGPRGMGPQGGPPQATGGAADDTPGDDGTDE